MPRVPGEYYGSIGVPSFAVHGWCVMLESSLISIVRLSHLHTDSKQIVVPYRIRKKARYQELVDKELMYDNLKALVDLDEARVNTVRTFIACRNKRLRVVGEP